MKHKITAVVAALLLLAAVAIGAVALKTRGDDGGGTSARVGAMPTSGTTPDASSTAKPDIDAADKIVVPATIVNPLTATHYCGTVRLLAIYTKQGYGLNKQQGVVDGRKFDQRLTVIAAAFERLAAQAPKEPKAASAAPYWQRLAEATTKAEETLRVVGLRTQSQAMIVELAQWKKVSDVELPRATASLKAACGFSAAVFR